MEADLYWRFGYTEPNAAAYATQLNTERLRAPPLLSDFDETQLPRRS